MPDTETMVEPMPEATAIDARAPRTGAVLRAMREVSLIVVGVLLALAGNSWWENRESRAREVQDLRLLLATTRENERRVNAAIANDSVGRNNADQLLSLIRSGEAPGAVPDTVEDLAVGSMGYSDFHPLTSVYMALANSGELALLSNDNLRARIVTLAGEIEGTEGQMRVYDDVAYQSLIVLGSFVDAASAQLRRASPNTIYRFRYLSSGKSSNARQRERAARRSSPDFEQAVLVSWAIHADRVNLLSRLSGALSALSEGLQGEMDRRGITP
jgi:hypothetical protein